MPLPPLLSRAVKTLRTRLFDRGPELAWRAVNLAAIVVSVGWFIALAQVHIKVIAQPGPQEFNEPAIWHVTWLLRHDRNPYSAAELPGSTMCFTPFYNYVVLAFEPLLGIDYPAHRMVNLVFLAASLALIVWAVRRAGVGLGIALLMAVSFYWMSLGNIQITARPDTLGLFLFLLAIFVPWARRYSTGSMVIGLTCAVLAFHCKFYFAVGGCATLLAAFFVRSRAGAIKAGFLFFAALGASFLAMCIKFPYLYIVTVIVQRGAAALNDRDDISEMHTEMFFARGWPFLLMMGFGLGAWLWRRRAARLAAPAGSSGGRSLSVDEKGLLMLGVALWIFTAIVYFYMGRNAGAYFTYHLHLLFPLIFVLAAHAVAHPWARLVAGLVLIVFVSLKLDIPPVPDSVAPYRRIEQVVGTSSGEVLGIAAVTDIFERTNRRVLHNGNTMFLGSAFADGGIERDPMIAWLARRLEETEAEVQRKVAAREYAVVLTEFDRPYFCTPEILQEHYVMTEQIDYYTYFGHSPVRVWRPKLPKMSPAPGP